MSVFPSWPLAVKAKVIGETVSAERDHFLKNIKTSDNLRIGKAYNGLPSGLMSFQHKLKEKWQSAV